jgi:drug/metabolite transporter (DMT)-like permease
MLFDLNASHRGRMKIDRGIVSVLIAAILFGLSTPIAKMLIGGMSPLLLAGLLYSGSGFGLACILGVRALSSARLNITLPRGTEVLWLLGAIIAGGAIAPYLLMYGLQSTDSASASLILNLEGVFTALLAWFAFKENVDRRIALGMACIVAGGIVLSLGPRLHGGGLVGPLCIVAACLAWAMDNNLTRKVSIHDSMFIACAKGVIFGPISVAVALHYGAPVPGVARVLQAGVVGFIGYGLSLCLFVVALRRLGTARTGAYFSLAPFIGAALAVALGAPLTGTLLVAGALMAAGVWAHLTEHHEHVHRHDALTHEHVHEHDAHHRHAHGPEWDGREPHSHVHVHEPLEHSHAHYPDAHHRHKH